MSLAEGARTTATTPAPHASAAEPIDAPASVYAASGRCDLSPAPDSTTTSICRCPRRRTTSGTSATRGSPAAAWLGTPTFISPRVPSCGASGY